MTEECEVCGKEFDELEKLEEHMNEEHEEKAEKFDKSAIKDAVSGKLDMDEEEGSKTSDYKVSTGIEGLDIMLEGGFPEGNLVLLTGGPGTGKTTCGLQFLLEGCENGESGVFVSLEEKEEKIVKNAERIGWDIQKYLDDGKLKIIKPPLRSYDAFKDSVDRAVSDMDAKRVVIDSITMLGGYFKNEFQIRKKIIELSEMMSLTDATVELITEIPVGDTGISTFGVEEFAVDGILEFFYMQKENHFVRGITVRKMRGSDHSEDIHPLKIGRGGLTVFPDEKVFTSFEPD